MGKAIFFHHRVRKNNNTVPLFSILVLILVCWVYGAETDKFPKPPVSKSFSGVQGAVLQKSPLAAASGYKYFRNYSKKEYYHHAQNLCITQNKNSIIFVGNLGGVLEYDGVSWRQIYEPNLSIKTITIDSPGTIFVGGKSEIGFLDPDSTGEFRYISLVRQIDEKSRFSRALVQSLIAPGTVYFYVDPEGNRNCFSLLYPIKMESWDLKNISQSFEARGCIYFRSSKYLFCWDYKEFKTWVSDKGFSAAYSFNDRIYVQQKGIGLQVLEKDRFLDIPDGSVFKDDAMKINMMVPFDGRPLTFLIGTMSDGLFLYDGVRATPFPTDIDNLFKERDLLCGIRLSSGEYALGTDGAGAIIIDSSGKIKHRFDISTGLIDQNVKNLYQEPNGNLWLALNNGIAKIEYESPFIVYDTHSRLYGTVLSMVKHERSGSYYIGTTEGLFTLSPFGSIQPVPGVSRSCTSVVSYGDFIIAATKAGVFAILNNIPLLIDKTNVSCLTVSREDPNRIWAGTTTNTLLISYVKNSGSFRKDTGSIDLKFNAQSIVEEPDGTLWIGSTSGVANSISFPHNSSPVVTSYGGTKNPPIDKDKVIREIYINRIGNQTVFATNSGLYRFDKTKNRFVSIPIRGKDSNGENDFSDGKHPIFRIAGDSTGNIWFHSESVSYKAVPQPGGSYRIDNASPVNKSLFRIPTSQVNFIYPETDAIWFCAYDSLVRYDTTYRFKEPVPFPTFIRRIERIDDKETIYGGHRQKKGNRFSFDYRNLRFHFAAPFYQDESASQYRYKLNGVDKVWSKWTNELKSEDKANLDVRNYTFKEYTGLLPGKYTFSVQAKNVYGKMSMNVDGFSFEILPPWYLTPLAFILYFIAFIFAIFGVQKYIRYRRLLYEKRHLEAIVEQRTHEIKEKNLQLEKQTETLTIQSEQLKEMDKVKSRFFATISHEFRTPLTLIMGPLEQIISHSPDNDMKNKALLMMRNSQRLLGLINQLLDLSRLHSGKMRLQAMRKNIIPFIRGIIASFQLLSQQHRVELVFLPQQEDITLYFNPENIEQILCNLLSNAVKNTPPGGSITVSPRIVLLPEKSAEFPDGFLELSVSDTGIGIPADQLPHIFELFYQVQDSYENKSKGSGIGLALTRELVELHRGDIHVQSTPGKGTAFTLFLPLGKSHLKPEEIIDVTQQPVSGSLTETCKTRVHDWEPVAPSPVESTPDHSPSPGSTLSDTDKPLILVVDDNADLRRYLCSVFETSYRVIEAEDGKQGFEKACETIPDMVISDVIMPHMDGFQLARRIKENPHTCHIPIILLTARSSHEGMLEGLQSGADDYIPKPFNVEVLAARVKNLIELRRQLQERFKNRMALQPQEITVSPLDDEFYTELHQAIEKNLADPAFGVEGLSSMLYIGRTTLYRKILAVTGETPNQFIRSYRLRRAAQLLDAHAGTVSEISSMVGFPNPSYFAHCFKEKFHYLPSDTPNEHRGDLLLSSNGPVLPAQLDEETQVHDPEIILVVEDNADVCDYIRDAMEIHYRVEVAPDGPQGLERAQNLIPDLVISDIMMPGFDGFELCRRIKTNVSTSHIPIVFLTAKASEKSIIQGLETGVDDYITKPFSTDILLARVRGILRLRSRLQETRKRQLRMVPDKIQVSSMDETFLAEVNGCIEANLSDFDFNVEVLADKLLIGRTTLYRKILALTGENPTHYIRSYRLNKAAQMLKEQDRTITDVAFDVGFSSTPYFTRCFKEMFHRLPSNFSDA